MTLGEYIKQYRDDQGMSQRRFAEISGLSNSYISMLEQNQNSKNGKPIKPTLESLKIIAEATGITLDALLHRLDDIDVDISNKPTVQKDDGLDAQIISLVRQLPDGLKLSVLEVLRAAARGARG